MPRLVYLGIEGIPVYAAGDLDSPWRSGEAREVSDQVSGRLLTQFPDAFALYVEEEPPEPPIAVLPLPATAAGLIAMITAGDLDAELVELEDAERERSRPRKTVLAAIEARKWR